jgi:hypothetical protein
MPVVNGGTGSTTAAAARTALGLSTGSASLQWGGGLVVANGTYYLTIYAPYAGTITSMDYFTGNGSFTANVQIAGVSVTGLSAVLVNSATNTNTVASAANVFNAGQAVSVIITGSTGSPTGVVLNLRITKS